MESLGQYLKKLREERGFTLQDVAEETKLREKYVLALEEDRFEALPAEVYAKLFLKVYAQFLKIDRKELYSRYESQRTPPQRTTVATAPKKGIRGSRWLALGAIVLLVAIAVVFISTSGHKADRSQSPSFQEEAETLPFARPVSESDTDLPFPEGTEDIAEIIAARDTAAAPASTAKDKGAMRLKILARDSSWLQVLADEDTLFYGFVVDGDEVEFEADRRFILTAGKPGEVQFFLNGERLVLPRPGRRTIHNFELERSRASQYVAGPEDTAKEAD